MLIIFGGLPGTGKTTIARDLARHLNATYLRIDTIEQAISAINDEGYRVAYAVAEDNLRLGRTVIADSVNPIQLSRDAWIGVAHRAGVRAVEVEVICSNPQLHRQRVETRSSDIRGLSLPTWEEVMSRDYEPWQREHTIIDTAGRSVAESVAELREALPMNEAIHFFTPVKDFAPALGLMARQAFSDAFAHLYDPVPFLQFLEEAYGAGGRMERDLAEPSIRWRVAAIDGQPIGYAKLSPLMAPAPAPQAGAMELQQIYVLGPWHGRGVAEELMNWAVDTARAEGAREIYLTVFDHNLRAKRFYSRHGFSEVGHCTFKLGDQVDDDRVWRKPLHPTANSESESEQDSSS